MISDNCITTYDYCAKDNGGFTHVVPTDRGKRGKVSKTQHGQTLKWDR